MGAIKSSAVAWVVASFLGAIPCAAALAGSNATIYSLNTPPSSLSVGCQAPCECPIVSIPTYGSFELIPMGSDPLYSYYSLEHYIASFNNGPGAVAITGSGRYKIGGEFAAMQQLTLDLQIQGGPDQHFDSGLTAVSVFFPQISISCAAHGFTCYDSVLVVDAKPIETTGTGPLNGPAGLEAAWPNPFAGVTNIAFGLDHTGPMRLAVLDLEGRRVRVLAAGQPMAAGKRTLTWDGRHDDGRLARAGIYWVLMQWPGGVDRRRIVKLD